MNPTTVETVEELIKLLQQLPKEAAVHNKYGEDLDVGTYHSQGILYVEFD